MKTIRMVAAVLVLLTTSVLGVRLAMAEESGVCRDLGCVGGETKCADGTMTYPGGQVVEFTCYTTLNPE